MKKYWHKIWGNRRQELVFIGAGMNQQAITAALEACLIGDGQPIKFSM